ncbi:MAG: L-threonylcarbamoyladenylate synthase [Arenimonas sp.]
MPPIPAAPISDAVAALKAGRLVAIPTETVYGLAADARNPDAVRAVFALKGRPADHPLIVHIGGAERIDDWAIEVPQAARELAARFWPGPLTLILKKRADVPDAVTGGQDTVGLRCPDNALTLALLREFGGGLAAPSANRFGRISPTDAAHVREEFGDATPLVLDGGPCQVGIESTIVDLSRSPSRILRHGRIGREQLLPFLPDLQSGTDAGSPRVSGNLESHYAPRTPMRLADRAGIEATAGTGAALLALGALPAGGRGLTLPEDPQAYAHGLYAALRALDAMAAPAIVVERPPQGADWLAINDRLRRAVTGSTLPRTDRC